MKQLLILLILIVTGISCTKNKILSGTYKKINGGKRIVKIYIPEIKKNNVKVTFYEQSASILCGQDAKCHVMCKYEDGILSGSLLSPFTIKSIEDNKIIFTWGKDKIIFMKI